MNDPDVAPLLALLSPGIVVLATWITGRTLEPGVAAISLTLRVAVVGLALALLLSGAAYWRARDREGRLVSGIGLVGNLVILLVGAAYLWTR
jgi:hypothetical protein